MTRIDEDFLEQSLRLLLTGADYGAYRHADRVRADDLLVRERAAALLASGVAALRENLEAWRVRNIPPATREVPYPPPAVMRELRAFEAAIARIADIEAAVRLMPAPASESARNSAWADAAVLSALRRSDLELSADARAVREACTRITHAADDADRTARSAADEALVRIESAIRERAERLRSMQ